ncbi:hypothetical protein PIB30_004660 [Stylosanthes scabra]|uniref:Uncharacterized protein n=1 Tax=Stylosanthes scabra TaxID=79078 RepID=A0ABU6Q3L4_9FABA|nr:hypothetical protein [Stylosanthes scabra]
MVLAQVRVRVQSLIYLGTVCDGMRKYGKAHAGDRRVLDLLSSKPLDSSAAAGASSPESVFRRDLKEKRDKDESAVAGAVRRDLMRVYHIPDFPVAMGINSSGELFGNVDDANWASEEGEG